MILEEDSISKISENKSPDFLELKTRLGKIRTGKIKRFLLCGGLTIICYITAKDVQNDPSIMHYADLGVSSTAAIISYLYAVDGICNTMKEEKQLVKKLKNK